MSYLAFYTVLWCASLALTGLSVVAMIIELRLNSVPVKLSPITFSLARRLRSGIEIIATYRQFKMQRSAFPLFIWTLWTFGAVVVLVPIVGLVHYVVFGFQ